MNSKKDNAEERKRPGFKNPLRPEGRQVLSGAILMERMHKTIDKQADVQDSKDKFANDHNEVTPPGSRHP